MQNAQRPISPLFEAFIGGIRIFRDNSRLILKLSFVPFVFTLLTLIALRVFNDSMTLFLLPLVQVPSSFVTGLQCGLLLRYLMLGEHPLAPEGEARRIRNKAITESALVFTAVTYFVTGVYAGLIRLQKLLETTPEAAAPYMPLAAALLVAMVWGARYLWLHIPVALDWPIRDFYSRIGKWMGSLRVFALFAMCSLTMNFLAGFSRALVQLVFSGLGEAFTSMFDDIVVAALTLLLSLLFMCASVSAIQAITQEKTK